MNLWKKLDIQLFLLIVGVLIFYWIGWISIFIMFVLIVLVEKIVKIKRINLNNYCVNYRN